VIHTNGLEIGYERTVASGMNLTVRPGERWFLIGPNGSGKSTFLRTVLGLLPALSGTVELDPDLADRSGIGFVPQRCEWTATLPTTVREFVSLGFVGLGSGSAERSHALEWALERVELAPLATAPYIALSGGQRQRALLARALVRRPRLLILDEPTEELDIASEVALLETLLELNRDEGTTLLFVTHELHLAAQYATHVALFANGGVQSGTRDEILEPSLLQRAFGARAPIDSAIRHA
jgi:ABC-type Mn2+/Zn2+ transport system ATPase subunit